MKARLACHGSLIFEDGAESYPPNPLLLNYAFKVYLRKNEFLGLIKKKRDEMGEVTNIVGTHITGL